MYGHPSLLRPGQIVEHRYIPGVPLVIVGGPREGVSGQIYTVRKPDGSSVPALEKNLKRGDTHEWHSSREA